MTDERGETLLSWTFEEYEPHERGRGWYVAAFVVAAALLVYAFVTRNFLFAVIIVMLAVVLYLRHAQAPPQIEFAITERGILMDGRFTPYDQLRDFWVVVDESKSRKVFFHARGIRPQFGVPLGDENPDHIRGLLKGHLPESEERDEPTADVIGRVLKL